ncbi:RNA recognition motif domain [Dillenia turbinata]|uniref:RNA recognition motif domain n=1 Tax=Dillenia turbinata TaxID=194707 RepID=A0AAN8UWG2_9MAGN
MPPKTVKKVPGPGQRRGARAKKTQVQPEPVPVVEEPVRVEEEEVAEVKEEVVKVEETIEEKPGLDPEPEPKFEPTDSSSLQKEDDVKELLDEYEKAERLELDEPDYEPEEEYSGVDYDEKEIEQEDIEEEGDEGEEEIEEGDVGDEDGGGDMAEEDMEDLEEIEGEEDEHAGEEHPDMIDAEEEEHHEVVNERRKRKEFEVFVGGLDKDATEDDLRKVFSEVGEVTEARLMMNPQTKKNKGFAFLRFATVEQAKRAVTELKNPVVNGKQCGVTPSQDSDTLFVGNICKTWTKEALKEKLKHYGIENFEDLTLVEDSNNDGMNRGFAFLEFSSRSDAMDAFKRLQKRDVVFGVDRNAKVSFADSFIDPGDEIMAQVYCLSFQCTHVLTPWSFLAMDGADNRLSKIQVKTVFVDGLPSSWDEDRVRELLKKYGEVEKIELARNMPSAKRKDFGFVTFDTHDAAVTCAKNINNAELGDGDNKAKVRARLSRPLQRGKGRVTPRWDFWAGRGAGRPLRGSWRSPLPHGLPGRMQRGIGPRVPPVSDRLLNRPFGVRDRRPPVAMPVRGRPIAPLPRAYDRRPPVPSYPKSGLKRDYGRRDDLPPRSRAVADYGSRIPAERRLAFREDYTSRGTGYPDLPRNNSRAVPRRAFIDDGYGQRFERPPPHYREGRPRDYDSVSGSKRPYSAMDDIPPRYADAGVRQSRARLDYEYAGGASQYGDAYGDRLGRSNMGYGGSRSNISGHDSHGLYSSRQGMGYGAGSFGGSDVGGMYSSSFGGDYMPRGTDVGGSSHSSMYPGRGLGGSSYMGGGGGSGSYY